jgi:Fur family iron response transcriptional regulator
MTATDTVTAEHLKQAGLRPTRQRLCLTQLLFAKGHRHLTAEQLHQEASTCGMPVSLATVYNTLHALTGAGLLHHVVVDQGHSYFDTNLDPHHHFYFETSGRLEDIHAGGIEVTGLPAAPEGSAVARVDVIVRVTG